MKLKACFLKKIHKIDKLWSQAEQEKKEMT